MTILLSAYYSVLSVSAYCEGHDQVRLVGDLMLQYNKYVRPVKNSTTVVIVDFSFFFSTVLDMVSEI